VTFVGSLFVHNAALLQLLPLCWRCGQDAVLCRRLLVMLQAGSTADAARRRRQHQHQRQRQHSLPAGLAIDRERRLDAGGTRWPLMTSAMFLSSSCVRIQRLTT